MVDWGNDGLDAKSLELFALKIVYVPFDQMIKFIVILQCIKMLE